MNNKGIILSFVLIFMLILIIIAVAFITLANNEINIARQQGDSLKAFFIAEAGVEKALYELTKDEDYAGEDNVPLGEGVYYVTITALNGQKEIVGKGLVPNATAPRAVRKVRVRAQRKSFPGGTIDSAVTSLTSGKEVVVKGTADIDGGNAAGIKTPNSNKVSITGDAKVNGSPPVLEKSPLAPFEDIFGMTKDEMKAIATVYTDQKPNEPTPANGITWIEGDASYTKNWWNGEGILIVTGKLRLTGGVFNGIIYIMDYADIAAGNADVNGALITEGDAEITGTSSIKYDRIKINNAGNYYPYEISSWEEM